MSIEKIRALEDDIKKCSRCSLCKMIPLPAIVDPRYADGCPASREFHVHGYSGSGKSIMALSLLDGRIHVDKTLADITYACTACGFCDVSCKFTMEAERHLINMALREHIVDEGWGLTTHKKTLDLLKKSGEKEKSIISCKKPIAIPGLKRLPGEKAEVLLFWDLLHADSDRLRQIVEKTVRLLIRAGIDVGILVGGGHDSGLFAYWTGHREAFEASAKTTTSLLDGLGVRTIVSLSGSDLGILRAKYPEYKSRIKTEVVHVTEYLDRLIRKRRLKLTRPVHRKVTYHDPCYLGRQSEPPHDWQGEYLMTHGCMTYCRPPKPINRGVNGVFDAPRNVIRSVRGIDFVEMHRIREYSFCCGGGGGVPLAYPRLAENTALSRVDEARAVGADTIVTACLQCEKLLSESQVSRNETPIPVIDIVELVFDAVGMDT